MVYWEIHALPNFFLKYCATQEEEVYRASWAAALSLQSFLSERTILVPLLRNQ